MDRLLTAITVRKIPDTELCGVVVLEQQADRPWTGACSRCAKTLYHDREPIFERQVPALLEPGERKTLYHDRESIFERQVLAARRNDASAQG